MFKYISRLFFPQRCFSCGRQILPHSEYYLICNDCASSVETIDSIEGLKCSICGDNIYSAEGRCFNCKGVDFVFEKNSSLFYYTNHIINYLVHKFKFKGSRQAGSDLARLIKPYLLNIFREFSQSIIVPVPLSFESFTERGYNQVELVLDYCGIRYDVLLLRDKHIYRQSRLSAEARRENIKGQFRINDILQKLITDKHIIVVDDIFTTGSTVNECASVLKDNGARSVNVVTFFRS